jgi:hypothetical protein
MMSNSVIIHANDWCAHCESKRFRPDGARRLRPYCRAKRVVRRAGTRRSHRRPPRIRLHQGFGRSR